MSEPVGRIVPGTSVEWLSQAQGSELWKAGTVVAFVAPGVDALDLVYARLGGFRTLHSQRTSLTPRYLVAVRGADWSRGAAAEMASLRGHRLPQLYLPYASVVERDNPDAPREA